MTFPGQQGFPLQELEEAEHKSEFESVRFSDLISFGITVNMHPESGMESP